MATVRKTTTKTRKNDLAIARKYTCGYGPHSWKLSPRPNGWYAISYGQLEISMPSDILVSMANETIKRRVVIPPHGNGHTDR